MRGQLRRARERYGKPLNSSILSQALLQAPDKEQVENTGNINHQEPETKVESASKENLSKGYNQNEMIYQSNDSKISSASSPLDICKNIDENKKLDAPAIPDDFLCPISLELMRDPVIVSTGQVDSIPLFDLFLFNSIQSSDLILSYRHMKDHTYKDGSIVATQHVQKLNKSFKTQL